MGIARFRWLLPLVAALASVSAEDSVQLYSKFGLQMVTSSTLHWIPATGSKMPNYTVSAEDSPVVHPGQEGQHSGAGRVCRANVNGVWVCGEAAGGRCRVSLLGEVRQEARHQLLQAVGGGARLLWRTWNKFTVPPPPGTVAAATNTYVARSPAQDGRPPMLGKAVVTGISGPISVVGTDGEEREYSEGAVLVEVEPVSYELSNVRLQLRRRRFPKREVRVLATTVLRNGAGTVRMRVDSELAYEYEHTLYWGQGRGIIKGLNTTVRAENGTIIDHIRWGLNDPVSMPKLYTAEYELEPGTAVNVTLLGNLTEEETPYEATLVATYSDGETLARPLPGVLSVVELRDVRAEFGPVYFLANNSFVPTTTTTTTTTTSTTTTTTTTTPAPEKKAKKPKPEDPEGSADNEVAKWPSDEGTAGGAQSSLKKEEEPDSAKKGRGAEAASTGDDGAAGAAASLALVVAAAALQRVAT